MIVPYKEEHTSLMEPMLIPVQSVHYSQLADLAFELTRLATGFQESLPESARLSLVEAVRGMNCYYSNLIEGHDTHPISIENALKKKFSKESKQRNLQLEAKAHIAVQQWLDEGCLSPVETTVAAITEIHRRFCELLPADLLKVEDRDTKQSFEVVPGKFRDRPVVVGEHLPISPAQIPTFLNRFEQVYSSLGAAQGIIATAAAHHRLLWIHPFLDGNGRVARLMSHASLMRHLKSNALWSVARGLARKVDTYKQLLAECDQQRRGDLDGRGNLSEENLVRLTQFFLETCIDQVQFMQDLMRPDSLRNRILVWTNEEIQAGRLSDKAARLFEAMLYRGKLSRSEAVEVLNVSERHARRIMGEIEDTGAIRSSGPREPFTLCFPYKLAIRWLPGLYPEMKKPVE